MHIRRMRFFLLIMTLGMLTVVGIGFAANGSSGTQDTFLPQMLNTLRPPELVDAWVEDQNAIRSKAFGPGENVQFHISGVNPANPGIDVQYKWHLTDECGGSQQYEETLTIPADGWEYQHGGTLPNCLGTHTITVTISYLGSLSTRATNFEVLDTSSQVIFSNGAHGFEKCGLPSIEQMQIWAQNSPYDVFNIYLGGDHFACNLLIDADWVKATAAQGWDFILTWAGHGTSCWEAGRLNYHPISSDSAVAYQEGRQAAEDAIAAARSLGFLGQKIIYYDVEGYSDVDPKCRPAMESFLEGWAARLHENGDKAGAYGSPCRSYLMDWVDNNPPLDDIWYARWSYGEYNPGATTDDSESALCPLPDHVWPDRRIRQYAGDHNEEWGTCDEDDKTCTINSITSNVMGGEITELILGE